MNTAGIELQMKKKIAGTFHVKIGTQRVHPEHLSGANQELYAI